MVKEIKTNKKPICPLPPPKRIIDENIHSIKFIKEKLKWILLKKNLKK